MTVESGFFDSKDNDRQYTASQLSRIFDGLLNDGVFASIGTSFTVVAGTGMTVNVGVGRGWFNHVWIYNDTILPIVLSASELILPRIDDVVIEINSSDDVRTAIIKIVKGTPNASPSNPVLTHTDTIHQYPLCHITVGAGVTEIVAANIDPTIGTAECPYVTGIISTIDTSGITAMLEGQFNAWFDNLQAQLDTDVAGHLQNEIDTIFANEIVEATANAVIKRDANGRAQVANPAAGPDIANRDWVLSLDPIGTIKTGLTNPFGEIGAVCNGAAFMQDDYPDLAALIPKAVRLSKVTEKVLDTSSDIYSIAYGNGKWVVAGRYYSAQSSAYYAAVWTASTIDSLPVNASSVWGGSGGYPMGNVVFNGSVFVLVLNLGYQELKIYTSTDGLAWTLKQTVATPNIAANPKIFFVNGKLIVTAKYSSVTYLTYCDNVDLQSWTAVASFNINNVTLDVVFGNGYYFLINQNYVYRSTNLAGPWSTCLDNEQYMGYNALYRNGCLVTGKKYSTNDGVSWNTLSGVSALAINSLVMYDPRMELYYYFGSSELYVASAINGVWTDVGGISFGSAFVVLLNGVVVGAAIDYKLVYVDYPYNHSLPTLTASGATVYIRVLP